MKRIVGIFICLILLLGLQALDVSGNQSGTWELANSPYTLTGDVTVPVNASLVIEAGVEVIFAGDYQITALGRMIAQGTEAAMIEFKASTDVSTVTHQGIRLEYEGGEPNLFDYCLIKNGEYGINIILSPVNITNCHFTYNEGAIHVFALGNNNPPPVLIEDNLIENSIKSAILITESSTTSVLNNEITGNGTGPQFRGAIQVSIQSSTATVTPIIAHNNIHNNHFQGITCVDMFSYGGINASIYNNVITENYTGVYFYNCTGLLYDNEITNNFIPGDMNSGAGVMCYGAGATPYIAGNLISGNYGGIFLTMAAQPIIGAPEMNHPYAYGLNTIQDNIDVNGTNNSVVLNNLSSTITILAKNNFWGTTDTAEIDATITDSHDNAALGTVVYLPLASDVTEYTLTLNITSDYPEMAQFVVHVKDLATLEVTNHIFATVDETVILSFTEAVDFTITGSLALGMDWLDGYCYYGPFDELNIVSLNADNMNETVDLVFTAGPRPYTFRTYEYINVNGNDVLPLLKDEFYTDQVKQLVYENDNNEIMLIGYQKYGVNGWENVIFDEELLYLDNDAQGSVNFINHQVSFIDNEYHLYSNVCVVVNEAHDQPLNSDLVTSKMVRKIMDSPWDMEISAWLEYTGNSAPLCVKTVTADYSDFLATDIQYSGDFNLNKMLNLTPNIEINYFTEKVLLEPRNLFIHTGHLYWTPCSMEVFEENTSAFVGYSVVWAHESSPETLNYAHFDTSFPTFDIFGLGLDTGISNLWVVGRFEDGQYTEPSNSILIPYNVANDDNDISTIASLQGNYPNPFNPETTISFNIPRSGLVTLDIYNIKGQKVKSLVSGYQDAGQHNVVWNGKDDNEKSVASGLYLYKMRNGTYSSTKKMILMK